MVGPTSFQRGFGDPDVPLVLGTYRGIRQWSAEPDGQLHGEAGHMWQPGVNVAACNPRTPLDEQPYPDGHDEALPVDCTCGFYAYWRIRSYRPVVGVVEGSGMVVRGPRGSAPRRPGY